jgi:hypothetical protein
MQHKKLAILVGGELREFASCYPTWKEITDIEHDLFISTWAHTEEQNRKMHIYTNRRVTSTDIHDVCPNAIINIETNNPSLNLNLSSHKQIYHWRKLFNMLFESNCCYDTVLLTRPDIFLKLNNFQDCLQNISDDRIYGIGEVQQQPAPAYAYVPDVLFFGKTARMVQAFRGLPYYGIDVKDIHYHLARHFFINDMYVQGLPSTAIDSLIFRSSMLGHENADWQTLQHMATDWFNKKHR